MVPVMTDDMREGNILRVWVEPFEELPVDRAAFVGEIPDLNGLVSYSPFGYYIKRKLFIHNMGHAMCAYLGWPKGCAYIYECVADTDIRAQAHAAMREAATALHSEYDISLEELLDRYIEDLLTRFGNRALGDTVTRVGLDPLRKLGSNDRLTGAALYCTRQSVVPYNIVKGIVAGLRYDNPADEAAMEMQSSINSEGIREFLERHCGLSKGTVFFEMILSKLL